ncbi:FecR domain-containing protein [Herbaspirillum sp. alder98]|uniref:FecR family protein n=1 Tax=Herbaspirillum sp. alder98 TaxID=2913096 RepID=UPI001CD8816E|nr:FecR domain-containing protein [Herbaspirillum sp. alder98]MCA1325074.1 FecR domain-containing protein [Herbaspirillum sp. alder98]
MQSSGISPFIQRPSLVALALVGLLAATQDARAQQPAQAGIVKVLKGDVKVERQGQDSAASVGLRLYPGDRVVTGVDAAAGITLRDDTLMSLGPKSTFVLEDFAFNESAGDGKIAVRLAKGTLRYVSGLIGKHSPQSQQVATPTATIGIRGTDFIVEVADE